MFNLGQIGRPPPPSVAQVQALTQLSPDPDTVSATETITYFYGTGITVAADVTGVVLQYGTILDGASNRVTVKDGAGVSLYEVTFEGDARTVILIDNDADTAATVTVNIVDLVAAAGSKIIADDDTNVTVTVDGIVRPLPYTHWANTRAAYLSGLVTDQEVSASDVIHGYRAAGETGTLQCSVDGINWYNLTAGATTFEDISEFSENGLGFDLFVGIDGVAWDSIKLLATGAVTVPDPWDLFTGGDVGALLMPGFGSRAYQSTNGAANSTAHMLPAGPGDVVGFLVDNRYETGPARTTYREEGERLINPEFNAGTAGWTSEGADTFSVTAGILRIVEAGATPLGGTQETGVLPYQRVRVQARFRKAGATGRCDFTIWGNGNETEELFDRNFSIDNGGSWNFIDNTFVAGSQGVVFVTVRAVDGCDIEFDLISVKAVPAITDVGTEVLPAPFFDEWADSTFPDGWTKGGTHDANNYFQVWSGGDAGLEAISNGTQTPYISLATSATNDTLYRIDYVVVAATAGQVDLSVDGTSTLLSFSAAGRGHAFVTADATGAWRLRINGTTDVAIYSLEIRPVPALANTTAAVTNGDFDAWTDTTVPDGWAKVGTHDVNNYVEEDGTAGLHLVSDSQLGIDYASALTAGKWYEIEVDVTTVTSGGLAVKDGAANVFSEIQSTGRWRKFYQAVNTGSIQLLGGATSSNVIVGEIVVNEIPGVCWEQGTTINKPTMRDDEYGMLGTASDERWLESSQDMTGVNAMMLAINLYGSDSDTIAICDGQTPSNMRVQRAGSTDFWKQTTSTDLFAGNTGEMRVNGEITNAFPRGEPHTVYVEKAAGAAGDFDNGSMLMAHATGGWLNGVFIFGFLRDSHLTAQERADLETYMAYMMGIE